jgi:hypothetical protein
MFVNIKNDIKSTSLPDILNNRSNSALQMLTNKKEASMIKTYHPKYNIGNLGQRSHTQLNMKKQISIKN